MVREDRCPSASRKAAISLLERNAGRMVAGRRGANITFSVGDESARPSESEAASGVREKSRHSPMHRRMHLLNRPERLGDSLILDMLHALLEQVNDMLVFNTVINFLAFFP